MNKKVVIGLVIIVVLVITLHITDSVLAHNKICKYKTEIETKDSIYNQTVDSLNNIIRYDEETIQFYKSEIDSYELMLDSIDEELEVAKIKLDRIKEYNRIAGKGNNITFLRGWINRVLNE